MGGTTIADLGSHLIDLAHWQVGGIRAVCAQAETFIRERPAPGGGTSEVTVDDAASALLRFDCGAIGTMEVARAAVRRPCDFTIEANGSHGTLVFDYARLNELRYGSAGDDQHLYGMRRIRAEHPSHPYAADWWPIGQGVGYGSSFVNQVADLLEGLAGGALGARLRRRGRGAGGVRGHRGLGGAGPVGRGQRDNRAVSGLTSPYAAWVSAHARSSAWAMSSGG